MTRGDTGHQGKAQACQLVRTRPLGCLASFPPRCRSTSYWMPVLVGACIGTYSHTVTTVPMTLLRNSGDTRQIRSPGLCFGYSVYTHPKCLVRQSLVTTTVDVLRIGTRRLFRQTGLELESIEAKGGGFVYFGQEAIRVLWLVFPARVRWACGWPLGLDRLKN